VWRKIKGDWEAWNGRDLSSEAMVRLILDGTVVRVRIDGKATAISLLVVLGVHADRQKVLLSVRNMGSESEAAWAVLDDLVKRNLKQPELAIVDGAPGLEKALGSLWSDLLIQRCTVHKLRNLIAHAPKRLAEEEFLRHGVRGQRQGGRNATPGVHPQMAAQVSRRCRQPGRGWRATLHLHAVAHRNGRARARRTPSSGYMRSSSGGSRRRRCCPPESGSHAVLGAARLRADYTTED
jgi:hypothetical protein